MKTVMGVDPGLAGGIVIISCIDEGPGNCKIFHDKTIAIPMPLVVRSRKLDFFKIAELVHTVDICFIEKVWGMPGLAAQSLCTCCKNYGAFLAVLKLTNTIFVEVAPRTWQAKMLPKKCPDTKVASIAVCETRTPEINLLPSKKRKPHDGMSDALCIALYGVEYWYQENSRND